MPASSLWRRATLVIAASAAPVLALAAPGATAARARAAASPNPSSTANTLRGVSAVSGSDAWAVGNYTNNTTGAIDMLILHWDGTAWAQVPAPSPSSAENVLLGVSAVSGSDAWAAGYYINNTSGVRNTLVLHWDGTAWAQVPAPSPGSGDCQLYGLSAVSGSGAWAAGDSTNTTTGDGVALILHWNGTTWTRVASPGVSSADNELRGVSAVSGSDAWAVGYYQNNATGAPADPLILHWNGTAWTRMAGPHPSATENHLLAVSTDPGGDAWAAGWWDRKASIQSPLLAHWNGTAWTRVASSHPSATVNDLFGVSAISASDAWAVGAYLATHTEPLIEHWNGTTWTQAPTPRPSPVQNSLFGVSAVSGSDAWAVGDYYNNATGAIDTLILHWNGTTWSKV